MTITRFVSLAAATALGIATASAITPKAAIGAEECSCFTAQSIVERCKFQEPDALLKTDRYLNLSCRPPAAPGAVERYITGIYATGNGKPIDWVCETVLIPDDGSKWTRKSTKISAGAEKACRGHIRKALKTLVLKDDKQKSATPSSSPAPSKSASDTYLAYAKASQSKATTVDAILAYHSAEQRQTTPSKSPGEQKLGIAMARGIYDGSYDLKVLSEKKTDKEAKVNVALCIPGGDRMQAEVRMVPEDGQWKLAKERWTNTLVPDPDDPNRKIPEKCRDCDTLAADPNDPQKARGWKGVAFDDIGAKEAISACRKAVAAHPNRLRFSFQLARALSKDEAYEEAAALFRKAAEKGYTSAMVGLGDLYAYGDGVDEDPKQAVEWFRKAIAIGNTDAMVALASLYSEGQGVKEDLKEAARLYRMAADKGNSDAMQDLADMYAEGAGVAKDIKQAVSWYEKAANAGVTDAMVTLGDIYADGKDLPKNMDEAYGWYERAAQESSGDGMVRLGDMYFQGVGVDKNADEAVYWYREAVRENNDEGMLALGWMYADGEGVKQDPKRAAELIFKSLELGNPDALKEMTENAKEWGKTFRQEFRRILKEADVYKGKIDGRDFGPETVRAIKALADTE